MPTGEGEEEVEVSQEGSSSTFTSQDQEASTSSPYQYRRNRLNEDEENENGGMVGIDDSGEIDERDFEPPRLSDASKAATERLGQTAWAPVESPFDKLKREVDNDFIFQNSVPDRPPPISSSSSSTTTSQSKAGQTSTTPKRNLAAQVLRNRYEQQNRSAKRAQATPRQVGNPFVPSKEIQSIRKEKEEKWNGIADLRKTPLAKVKGGQLSKGKEAAYPNNGNDTIDSLDWPMGMSPPVTMQFSVPHKKYNKTPGKGAAAGAGTLSRENDPLRIVEDKRSASKAKDQGETSHGQRWLISTPLKRGPQKGRKSLPTPPTVTKRIGTHRLSRGLQDTQSPAGTSSSKLLDEDEDGNDEDDDDNHDDKKVGTTLESGLDKLSLAQTSSNIDKLLEIGEDDEDSEEEESESDEEEENAALTVAAAVARTNRMASVTAVHRNGEDYPTSSSLASTSRSIDQDTLFGIRDPHSSKPSIPPSSLQNISNFHSSSSEGPAQSSSTTSSASGAINQQVYQPMGSRLYEQGTVYGGRPLLGDDREDTFSAPSPTPATAAGRRSKE